MIVVLQAMWIFILVMPVPAISVRTGFNHINIFVSILPSYTYFLPYFSYLLT